MKKKIIIIVSVAILVLIAALSLTTIAYSKSSDFKSNTLPDNITVNGVDCSGLTYGEAEAKLTGIWNQRHVVVTGGLGEKLASYTDFGCTYDIAEQLKDVKQHYLIFVAANHYLNTPVSVNIPMLVSDYDDSFKKSVLESDFLNKKDATDSKNAYVDTSNPKFPIIPEVYGTKTDSEKFFSDLLHHIQTGNIDFSFNEKKYYTMPEITSDDESLKEYQKYCKKYLKQEITYLLGEETFTISSEQLDKLMADDRSGNPNKAAVHSYVKQLASTYDNIGAKRTFTSFTGRKITSVGGTYGWEIDQEKEAKKLISDIASHKNVKRKPVFSSTGFGEYSKGVGDTYIDVDISNQVVKSYKKGKLVFSCPCVTGCRNKGTTTSIGTYYILNKVRNVVLRGDNGDGTRYASPVSYWMGVTWGGEGFHDATWKSVFGGTEWIYRGSHGCINLPLSRIPELYNSTEVGTPVITHY